MQRMRWQTPPALRRARQAHYGNVRRTDTVPKEMPAVVDPMMAVLAGDIPAAEESYGFEFKWDGIRAVAFWDGRALRLQTRNRKDANARYPELKPSSEGLNRRREL